MARKSAKWWKLSFLLILKFNHKEIAKRSNRLKLIETALKKEKRAAQKLDYFAPIKEN